MVWQFWKGEKNEKLRCSFFKCLMAGLYDFRIGGLNLGKVREEEVEEFLRTLWI